MKHIVRTCCLFCVVSIATNYPCTEAVTQLTQLTELQFRVTFLNMPSLPVDNQALDSNEDAYRRYFGAFKKSSPPKPRRLLIIATIKICLWAMLGSIPGIVLFYIWVYQYNTWYDHDSKYQLYNIYPTYKFCITFILCLAVIHVIYQHKYANKWTMRLNAFIISLISCGISYGMQHYCTSRPSLLIDKIFTTCLLDEIYFYAIHFPLTLYFSILVMYFAQYGKYCCRCFCLYMVKSNMTEVARENSELTGGLIDIRTNTGEEPEILEDRMTNTTGSVYQDEDGVELSLSLKSSIAMGDRQNRQNTDVDMDTYKGEDNESTGTALTYQELESAAKKSMYIL